MPEAEPRALLGVRACDLAAMDILDRVGSSGPFDDPRPRARNADTLIVAVNCTRPGALCFCASTDTGPRAGDGADLVITEREDDFLVEAPSERGKALLEGLPAAPATEEDAGWLGEQMRRALAAMARSIDTEKLPERLFAALEHPRRPAEDVVFEDEDSDHSYSFLQATACSSTAAHFTHRNSAPTS